MNKPADIRPLPPEVEAWLSSQPADERKAMAEAWRAAGEARPLHAAPDAARRAATWSALEAAAESETHPSPLRLVRMPRLQHLAVAAAIAVLFGAGLSLWLTVPQTFQAPTGTTATITLPDGSFATLNSGTTLSYNRLYRTPFADRRVALQGEAFFDVERGQRSFVVETFNAEVAVLGTRFNVRARSDEDATAVTVEEGRVRLATPGAHDGVVLTAGQASRLAAGAGTPTPAVGADVDHVLAWRTGDLAFSNEPFGLVLDEIGRRFDVAISAELSIRQRTVSFYKHQPQAIEQVVEDLSRANGLLFRETANGFQIYRPGR